MANSFDDYENYNDYSDYNNYDYYYYYYCNIYQSSIIRIITITKRIITYSNYRNYYDNRFCL